MKSLCGKEEFHVVTCKVLGPAQDFVCYDNITRKFEVSSHIPD